MRHDGPGRDVITSRPVVAPPAAAFGRWRSAWRLAGVVLGVGAALHWGPLLAPVAGPAPLPLRVDLEVGRAGEIGPVGSTQVLALEEVRPGAAVQGELEIASTTWLPVSVSVRDVGPSSAQKAQALIRVTLDDEELFDGALVDLEDAPSRAAVVEPGHSARLAATVTVPEGADDTYQGRTTDIRLDLITTRAED